MQSKCMYLRFRKKQGKTYCYCTKKRAIIELSSCSGCINKEYKKVAKMVAKKPLNKVNKNNKVRQATSIPLKVKKIVWERDNHCCIFCGKHVDLFFANSHYIKRSHNGKGIEENIMTNCQSCHSLFEESQYREKMLVYAKKYFMSKYDYWNEDILIYKKWGN